MSGLGFLKNRGGGGGWGATLDTLQIWYQLTTLGVGNQLKQPPQKRKKGTPAFANAKSLASKGNPQKEKKSKHPLEGGEGPGGCRQGSFGSENGKQSLSETSSQREQLWYTDHMLSAQDVSKAETA